MSQYFTNGAKCHNLVSCSILSQNVNMSQAIHSLFYTKLSGLIPKLETRQYMWIVSLKSSLGEVCDEHFIDGLKNLLFEFDANQRTVTD